jgi:SNF2 family DNA or RNA helicase
VVNGNEKNLDNYETHEDSITLIQYQAGSKGLNLQKANRMIFFTPTLSAEDYLQARKRIHRINQTKTCFYYLLVCESSVEERIYRTLAMRKDYTEELFRDECC